MASKLLEESVTQVGDAWDFACPGVKESACRDQATGAPFASTGWPTKETALARGREHFDEHLLAGAIAEAYRVAKAAADEGKDPEPVDVEQVMADTGLSPMSTLGEFRAAHGLGVDTSGNAVTLEELA